jgi:ABC-type transporter lipoprotein component MlaA/pimeloyl-ACP methyl ester carboxylesterase
MRPDFISNTKQKNETMDNNIKPTISIQFTDGTIESYEFDQPQIDPLTFAAKLEKAFSCHEITLQMAGRLRIIPKHGIKSVEFKILPSGNMNSPSAMPGSLGGRQPVKPRVQFWRRAVAVTSSRSPPQNKNMTNKFRFSHLAILTCLLVGSLQAQTNLSVAVNQLPATNAPSPNNGIILPKPLADPIEPFNRAVWSFNKGLITVIRPAAKGYRFVIPRPVRKGIGNVGRNLLFPGRFINELLQGNWNAMGDETARCLCNTIFGIGGIFDVATRGNIPEHNADFGQTFRKWGLQPSIFLMLPLLGPSDVRDGTGLAADYAANPLNYFYPYGYIGSGVMVNNLSDSVDEAFRFSQSEADPYSILQYAWTLSHENRTTDMSLHGSQDEALLETLRSVSFSYKDPEFLSRGKTRSVLIPATGKNLNFTFWLQPRRAPIVYLIPGFGAHRLAGNELGLAELLVMNGFSVVTVSSTFHPEFMEHASLEAVPAYPPIGIKELHAALTQIDGRLAKTYPQRLGARAIMGYSLGGFQSLFMAGTEATNTAGLIPFQRYVAIDSPVRLRYAATNLDSYYQAPMSWPAAEREVNIHNTLLKVAALAAQPGLAKTNLPFNTIESQFLVGLSFRLSLRDIIFSSQLRHNQGILQSPIKNSRRRAAYDEILNYSFRDYIQKFATPYDRSLGLDLTDPEVSQRGTDLEAYTDGLRANPNIRVILNRNDLFLNGGDLAWIETTFARSQVTEFPNGGHVGNLAQPEVQHAILQALDGLGATPNTKRKQSW